MGGILQQWRVSTTSMLLYLLLQAWLLGSSFASAEFLTPVPDHGNATTPDLCQKDTVMSCNLVQLDLARLHDSSVDFMGTTLDFKDMPGDNTYTFSSGFSEASFTVDTDLGVVWGHVQLEDGRDLVIEPSLHICEGCHVVIEENEDAIPPDHAEFLQPSAKVNEEMRSNVAFLLETGKRDQTTPVTYSVMLYYTPEVRAAVESSGGDLKMFVNQMIDTTNQGYINSNIPIRAVVHCLEETPEPEAYFTGNHATKHMLDVFRDYMGGGNNLRRSADIATLLVTDASPASGWGYVFGDGDYEQKAVTMVQYDYALNYYIFGHEVGHTMGLSHDKYDTAKKGGSPLTPYSFGYHIPDTKAHTIMAYPHGNQRSPINVYSNPKLETNGHRLGKDGEADAVKRMTSVRFAIAANGDESEPCQPRGCIIEKQIAYDDKFIPVKGKMGTKVKDQDACAKLSLLVRGAYFWSYLPAQRLCYLQAKDSGRTPYAGVVSGNSECGRN